MKRPLFLFCITVIAAEITAVFLPRAYAWMPAAFLLLFGVGAFLRNRKAPGFCIAGGALFGVLIIICTNFRYFHSTENYIGEDVNLAAEVYSVSDGYSDSSVNAVLVITSVNGSNVNIKASCDDLPYCTAGDIISGNFTIAQMDNDDYRLSNYADGVFYSAYYNGGLAVAGHKISLMSRFSSVKAKLSESIRFYLSNETGSVLAAMTVGDKSYLSASLKKQYQRAGTSHLLVVSGLHLSLLCGLIPLERRKKRSRFVYAIGSAAAALFVAAVTGGSPSILRAALSVWICSIGILLGLQADPVTSLAVSGVIMSASNYFAVCDVGYLLSYSATAGVLFADGLVRQYKKRRYDNTRKLPLSFRARALSAVGESMVCSLMACAFTIPVLSMHNMTVTTVSVLTNLPLMLLVSPILLLGFSLGMCGLFGFLYPLTRMFALLSGILIRVLNAWVAFCASLPAIRFTPETSFPAVVMLLTAAYYLLCRQLKTDGKKTLIGIAAICIAAAAASCIFSANIVKIALVGNASNPAVVIVQNNNASVLFRGGYYNEKKVKAYLEARGIETVNLLIDLRMSDSSEAGLEASESIRVLDITESEQWQKTDGNASYVISRSKDGAVLLLDIGYCRLGTVTGSADKNNELQTCDILLFSASNPAEWLTANAGFALSDKYKWYSDEQFGKLYLGSSGSALWIRPGEKTMVRYYGGT